MRQFKYFVCVFSLILLGFTLPIASHADNVVIYGCYQKINGQLRLVSSTDNCLASELPISWVAQSGQSYGPLTLYVNGTSGLDQSGYGKSASKAFKTISYALSQVPLLRNSEYRATINVAPGVYNESLNISLGSITIIGADPSNTEIVGISTKPVIEVYSRGVVLSKLKVTNGNIGVYAERATLTVNNCIIQNSQGLRGGGFAGITVNYNTSLNISNSQIHSNIGNGIWIYRESSLVASNVTISENGGTGIEAYYTAYARVNNCQIERNKGYGIAVSEASSLQVYNSTISDNNYSGIDTNAASSARIEGGNVIKGNNLNKTPRNAGISISNNAHVTIAFIGNNPKDEIIENYNGIFIDNNAAVHAVNAIIENNYGNGVDLNLASSGIFENDVFIRYNTGYGIVCDEALLRNSAYVDSNGVGQVLCSTP